jgi:hypothetical protein
LLQMRFACLRLGERHAHFLELACLFPGYKLLESQKQLHIEPTYLTIDRIAQLLSFNLSLQRDSPNVLPLLIELLTQILASRMSAMPHVAKAWTSEGTGQRPTSDFQGAEPDSQAGVGHSHSSDQHHSASSERSP